MTTANTEDKPRPRTIKLVLEDDGGDKFRFFCEGDIDRIGKIEPEKLSAAEFWAIQFYALCQEQLDESGGVKKLPQPSEVKTPLIIAP